jgi:hypothetical protein
LNHHSILIFLQPLFADASMRAAFRNEAAPGAWPNLIMKPPWRRPGAAPVANALAGK